MKNFWKWNIFWNEWRNQKKYEENIINYNQLINEFEIWVTLSSSWKPPNTFDSIRLRETTNLKEPISHILSENKHKTVIWSEYKISCRNMNTTWTHKMIISFSVSLLYFHFGESWKRYSNVNRSFSFHLMSTLPCYVCRVCEKERNMNKLKSRNKVFEGLSKINFRFFF